MQEFPDLAEDYATTELETVKAFIKERLNLPKEKADILIEIGMHCLGCPASQMETLEEACEVHGIDVEEVVKKLNEEE